MRGLNPQAEGYVFKDGHVAEQGIVLEDETDAAACGIVLGGVLFVEQDGSAVGRFQAGDHAQQSGFARARRPEQGEQFSGADLQAYVIDGHETAELLADIADLYTHICPPRIPACSWISFFTTSVTTATRLNSEATANAAAKLYSL